MRVEFSDNHMPAKKPRASIYSSERHAETNICVYIGHFMIEMTAEEWEAVYGALQPRLVECLEPFTPNQTLEAAVPLTEEEEEAIARGGRHAGGQMS